VAPESGRKPVSRAHRPNAEEASHPQAAAIQRARGGPDAVGPQTVKDIIDVFRADSVSFLTPALSTEIKDETTIDISH
jgi:hypothetical protein